MTRFLGYVKEQVLRSKAYLNVIIEKHKSFLPKKDQQNEGIPIS